MALYKFRIIIIIIIINCYNVESCVSRKTRSANNLGVYIESFRFPRVNPVSVNIKYTSNMAACYDDDVNNVTTPHTQWFFFKTQCIKLETERHCASMIARESSEIPGRLLHTCFRSRRPSTTTLSQSITPYSAALPVEHVRGPGLFARRYYFVELFTGSSP